MGIGPICPKYTTTTSLSLTEKEFEIIFQMVREKQKLWICGVFKNGFRILMDPPTQEIHKTKEILEFGPLILIIYYTS